MFRRRILITEAHMPFAEHSRMVARHRKEFGKRHLILGKAHTSCTGEINLIDANPDIVSARIQSDTGWGTGDLRVKLGKPHALISQFVEIRGWSAAQLAAAVDRGDRFISPGW
jgi:hypothetical protein